MRKTAERAQRFVSNPLRRRYLAWTRRRHDGPRVLANSYPKAGTYLLRRCLELLPQMVNYHDGVYIYTHHGPYGLARRRQSLRRMGGGTFVQAHLDFKPESRVLVEQLNVRHLLMVRDPRDVAVSYYKFQMSQSHLPHYHYYHGLPDDAARLMATIVGDADVGLFDMGGMRSFLPWVDHGALLVRFEALVGVRGGGDDRIQRDTVRYIIKHIGLAADEALIERVADRLFNPNARTFRKGSVGGWREHFSAEHIAACKAVCNDVLLPLGYETRADWT